MGSSASGYFKASPEDVIQRLRESEKDSDSQEFNRECSEYLSSLLADFNDRNRETIGKHLDNIRTALEADLEGTIDLKFGGSVRKHTYLNGISDIDSLVMLDSCELAERPPEEAQEYLESRLIEHFPTTPIHRGELAITLEFEDIVIQLLPAVSCHSSVKIPDSDGHNWSRIQPKGFTQKLKEVNNHNGGKVVPVIKLAKALIHSLPKPHQITGYHAESLAVEVFKAYKGPFRLKEMLHTFFETGSNLVLEPIRDSTEQSVHVDDYLGAPGSPKRRLVADAFSRMVRRMRNADASQNLSLWHGLFED